MVRSTVKQVKDASYVYISCYCDDGRLEKSIGKDSPLTQRRLSDIRSAVSKYKALCELSETRYLKDDVLNIITGIIAPGKKPKNVTLSAGIETYIEALRKGKTRDGRKASLSTIRSLEYALKFIERNSKLGSVDIERFCMEEVAQLHKVLLTGKNGKKDGKLSQNTAFAYCTAIMSFFKYTFKAYHNNPIHREEGIYLATEKIEHAVFYRVPEIMALYALPLSGLHEKVRDMFVYGCFTCMRISDHNKHSEVNITPDYIKLNTVKTGKTVTIPLHPVVRELLVKYGGKPPKVADNTFNDTIKRICRDAKGEDGKFLFHDKVMFKRIEGGEKKERMMARWMLTSSHTMRRSFVTNALLSGMPDDYIKRIGGWISDSAFNRYKRASDVDIADRAALLPFFKAG